MQFCAGKVIKYMQNVCAKNNDWMMVLLCVKGQDPNIGRATAEAEPQQAEQEQYHIRA